MTNNNSNSRPARGRLCKRNREAQPRTSLVTWLVKEEHKLLLKIQIKTKNELTN